MFTNFEAAADAIVSGDIDTLRRLLDENPELIHANSTREHRCTLLHYVGANGFEAFRQKSPKNAVEIADLLLERGADVDAVTSGGMGIGTTLGLVATSVHTHRAGVQIPLLETDPARRLGRYYGRHVESLACGTTQRSARGCEVSC